MKPLYALFTVLAISIIIHASFSFLTFKSNKTVVDRIDKVAETETYQLGYNEGYHRATEDLADLNSTKEYH
jgi:hypothetical protein